MDLIKKVGPAGNFIEEDHTLDHCRETWYPTLFDRDRFAGWKTSGGKDIIERARERASDLLGE